MTVKVLIKKLQKFNPDYDVILQKDSEGNGYSPLTDEIEEGYYEPETAWYGERVETTTRKSFPAIFLAPTN